MYKRQGLNGIISSLSALLSNKFNPVDRLEKGERPQRADPRCTFLVLEMCIRDRHSVQALYCN